MPESRFIVDNSVWARLGTSAAVADAFRSIVAQHSPMAIWICPPVAAEIAIGARNPKSHAELLRQLTSAFMDCPISPSSAETLQIQGALWDNGLVRAAGAMDTLIAAYALANDAAVLHYDGDFEHIASVVPGFTHRWIVPRGSV